MKKIIIKDVPGFEKWRTQARQCLMANLKPQDVVWNSNDTNDLDLFSDTETAVQKPSSAFSVNQKFLDLARTAACHSDPDRFQLLYRILWRMCHENKKLLHIKTDNDILKLNAYVKAVRRDAYKIKAFLRFKETRIENEEYFIAWYEPEHYSLELSLPFFQTRFKNMNWSILTPYLGAFWNGNNLQLEPNPDPSIVPQEDRIEQYWLKYYATTFNPARPKKNAMLSQMPKKYWKNMPETVLIEDLLKNAETRVKKMIEKSKA